jgi:hypothetical protein
MDGYAPPGWPATVRPPAAPEWEQQAVEYLLDCCPPHFRGRSTLLRHPVVLATFAEHCVAGQRRAAVDGLGAVRVDLADRPPEVVAEAIDIWHAEEARLARVQRGVGLLRRALQGERFVPRMGAERR